MSRKKKLIPAAKIVICVDLSEQHTESGIYVPSTGKDKPELAKVIAVGTGKKPVEFKIGDTIVYRRYTDNKVMVGTEEFNHVRFEDILSVLK